MAIRVLVLPLLLLAVSSLHAEASRPIPASERASVDSVVVRRNVTVIAPHDSPAVQVERAAQSSQDLPVTSAAAYGRGGTGEEVEEYSEEVEEYSEEESSGPFHYPDGGYGRKEKSGMSDTRFLENGRFFYDVNGERGYGLYAGIGVEGDRSRGYEAYNSEGNEYEHGGEESRGGEEYFVPSGN